MFKLFGTPKPGDIKKVAANADDVMPDAGEAVNHQRVEAMAEDKKKDKDGEAE